MTVRAIATTSGRLMLMFGALLCLDGSGLFAAPCRVASAGLDIIPFAGHVLAAPTNGCAATIDP